MDGGFISGANGIIPAWCGILYGMPGISLLAETIPMLKTDPGYRAIILALNEQFGFGIPTESINIKVDQMAEVVEEMKEKGSGEQKMSRGNPILVKKSGCLQHFSLFCPF